MPDLAGLQRLVDGLLSGLGGAVLPGGAAAAAAAAAALHDAGELHLLVPGARQHVVGLAVLVRHQPGHLGEGEGGGERERSWLKG